MAATSGPVEVSPDFPNADVGQCYQSRAKIHIGERIQETIVLISRSSGNVYESCRELKRTIYGMLRLGVLLEATGVEGVYRRARLVAIKNYSKHKLRFLILAWITLLPETSDIGARYLV